MSERNVLKLDIDSITEFQKELHYSKDPNNNQVKSRFSCVIDKYAWSTHSKAKMIHTADDGEVVYTASKKFDVLFKSEIHINLFPIKVKGKYKGKIQICYPHNLGHNIPYQGELKVDDDHLQTIDSIWLDINAQFYMKSGAGFRHHYKRMIGSVPCLEEWSTELPGLPLVVPQPFHYSKNTRVALLLLNSSMTTVTHKYKLRNKICEILRMRYNLGTESQPNWQEIQPKLRYLDVPTRTKQFPIPELWGRYTIMSDAEREWHKSIDPVTNEPIKHSIYTEDIIMITSNNPTPIGSTDVIPLHCKSPCKALFWVAQDVKAIENLNFSNYTTDSENLNNGWNPCSTVSLKYAGAPKIDKLSNKHFDLSEPWDFFPSAPDEPGYNACAFGYELNTLNSDTAIVFQPLSGKSVV